MSEDVPTDALRVFCIDDGERHWYVAPDAETAKREHADLMEPDDGPEQWIVEEVARDVEVTVSFDDASDLPKPLPEGARIQEPSRLGSWRVSCTATAGAWAATYTSAAQLCSSVW